MVLLRLGAVQWGSGGIAGVAEQAQPQLQRASMWDQHQWVVRRISLQVCDSGNSTVVEGQRGVQALYPMGFCFLQPLFLLSRAVQGER